MEKYTQLLDVNKNGLITLLHLLDRATAHVQEKGIEESALLTASLAPDMYNFTRQIQVASDDARRNLRLLAGKEHIKMDDTETTISELRTRIEKTQEIINQLTPADFEGADDRHVSYIWMGEHYVEGRDIVTQFAIQNFMFHLVTAYAILRKEGVPLGKQDFICTLNMHPKRV